MAIDRKRCAAIAAAGVLSAGYALGCGGSFDEAPPTLPYYLHRLPAKSLEQIYGETTPPLPDKGWEPPLIALEKFATRLTSEPAAQLLPEVQRMLEQERYAQEPNRWIFNALHDVRNALEIPGAAAEELAAYIRWRVERRRWFGWTDAGESPLQRYGWDKPKVPPEQLAEIERQLATASPPLRAQWIYLRGALGFLHGEDTESQRWFQRVVDEYPGHPRAEAALFMAARCQLSRSRSSSYKQEERDAAAAEHRPRALELFTRYLEKYPRGAFAADALGWLGAVAFDDGDYAQALQHYIRQSELPDHPELRRSALIMCERVLSRLAEREDEALDQVAAHPRLAMGLIYLIVNAEAHQHDQIAEVLDWRKRILPRLARAVAAREEVYPPPVWEPRYLAILAFAASGAGEQPQALKLTAAAAERPQWNDDLSFVRAVVLQRDRRFADAIAAYREFLRHFPRSPLARGAQLQLALALQDNGEAGEAILALEPLLPTPEEEERRLLIERAPRDLTGAEPAQVEQLIDTLRNFAPLSQLIAVLPKLEPAKRVDFHQLIAQRHLAAEEFAEARKYVPPAQWEERAAKIETLTRQAASAAAGARRAEACLRVGDAWAAARGQLLTFPLDSAETRGQTFNDEHHLAAVKRAENAQALGFTGAVAAMEQRDELWHAREWWLRAHSTAPAGSAAGATALWRALEAMPKIADVSVFTLRRAAEGDAAGLSRRWHAELRQKYPRSPEATKLAAYWSFPTAEEEIAAHQWGGANDWTPALAEALWRGSASGGGSEEYEQWKQISERADALRQRAGELQHAEFKAEVEELQRRAHAEHRRLEQAFMVNLLDDLSDFAQEADTGPEVRRRYVQLRFAVAARSIFGYAPWFKIQPGVDREDAELRREIAAAMAEPQFQVVRDYLQFLDLAVVANHLITIAAPDLPEKDGEPNTYRTRDYPLMEKLAAAFLEQHPRSRKRGAAILLHARAIYMQSKPAALPLDVEWPEAGRWGGERVTRLHQRAPFEPHRVLQALDAYDREYPGGRYAAVVRAMRGDVAARRERWQEAVELAAPDLIEQAHASRREEAAQRAVELFMHLKRPEHRLALLGAIGANPPMRHALVEFLNLPGADHPLRYLREYLQDQLGALPQ
jgi:TolA-binding protein